MSAHDHTWQELVVLLTQFPAGGVTVATALSPAWLTDALHEQAEDVYHPAGDDCDLDLMLRREVDGFRVMGTLHFTVGYQCGRCLEFLEQEFEVSIDTLYLPAAKYAGEGKTLREIEEEMEVHLYKEDEIDLMPMLSEEVLLALPSIPSVETDDRDRCLICGKTMEAFFKEESPAEQPVDPRWAKLRQLKVNNS